MRVVRGCVGMEKQSQHRKPRRVMQTGHLPSVGGRRGREGGRDGRLDGRMGGWADGRVGMHSIEGAGEGLRPMTNTQ
jgi:hypothetical protein